MPAPLMHIALALVALQGPLSGVDKESFIIGTCFPDIRYLKVIEREKTHISSVSWNQILGEKSDFRRGFLFHSFVDGMFNKFVDENDIRNKIPQYPYAVKSLKIFIDKVMYKDIKAKLTGISEYFEEVTSEELKFGIEEKAIIKWHNFIKNYCSTQYQCNYCILAKDNSILTNDIVDKINELIVQMDKNEYANEIAPSFYNFATEKIKKQQSI